MARLMDLAEGRSDIFKLRLDLLQVRPEFNARDFSTPENQAHVDSLAQSIAAVGIRQPLTVTLEKVDGKEVVYLDDGESRFRAVPIAIEKYGADPKLRDAIPCQSSPRHDDDADRALGLIIRNSGKPLTPLEQAGVYKRVLNMGLSVKDVAARAGVSQTHVEHLMVLMSAPVEAKEMISRGEASASIVVDTIRRHGKTEGVAALKTGLAAAKAAGKSKVTAKTLRKETVQYSAEQMIDILRTLQFIAAGKASAKRMAEEASDCLTRLKGRKKAARAA